MLRWYSWLWYEMKKKDEERRRELEHQTCVSHMIKSADGGSGLLHKITKPTAWRGVQILKEGEDVEFLARCEEKRKEWEAFCVSLVLQVNLSERTRPSYMAVSMWCDAHVAT